MKLLHTFLLTLISFLVFAQNKYTSTSSLSFLSSANLNTEIDLYAIDVELIEAGVFHLTNLYRAQKNRKALQYNEKLSFAALTHSEQMNSFEFFDHTNKKNKVLATLEQRVNYAAYSNYETLAENIFYGYIDLEDAGSYRDLCNFIVKAFISSKGHRENLVSKDLKEIGCGIYFQHQTKDGYWYFYFTQDFGATSAAL